MANLQTGANIALTRGNIGQAIAGLPNQVGLAPSFGSVFATDKTAPAPKEVG